MVWVRRGAEHHRRQHRPDQRQQPGTENVATGSGTVAATHYALRGGLNRDLWYAGATLVHVRFAAEDGSQVDYVLR